MHPRAYLCCLCGAEQHSLAFLRQQLNDLTHLLLKTNLKDAISLVNNKAGQVAEHKAFCVLQVVQQTTGGGNLHMGWYNMRHSSAQDGLQSKRHAASNTDMQPLQIASLSRGDETVQKCQHYSTAAGQQCGCRMGRTYQQVHSLDQLLCLRPPVGAAHHHTMSLTVVLHEITGNTVDLNAETEDSTQQHSAGQKNVSLPVTAAYVGNLIVASLWCDGFSAKVY